MLELDLRGRDRIGDGDDLVLLELAELEGLPLLVDRRVFDDPDGDVLVRPQVQAAVAGRAGSWRASRAPAFCAN